MLNKTSLELAHVTEKDFRKWCKDNNKSHYLPEVKQDFYARILDGRLAFNTLTGEFQRKRKKRS